MPKQFMNLLKTKSPEELAEEEFKVLRDTQRVARIPLLRTMQEVIDDDHMDGVKTLWPFIVETLALRMRISITMKVQMKRAVRARVRAKSALDALDRDYTALIRENETLRIKLRKLKGNK